MIIGGLVVTASVAIIAFACFLHWVNGKRDDGYFTTGTVQVGALNHALTSDLDVHRGLVSVIGKDGFSRVRTERDMFIGVARSLDVDDYLRDTSATRLTDFDLAPFRPYYTETVGDADPGPRGEQDIWTAKAQGSGTLTLDWDVERGGWTLVLMNADGSTGIDAMLVLGLRKRRPQPSSPAGSAWGA